MGFHLGLVEQSGNEQVIAECDGANIVFGDPASIQMSPAGGDNIGDIARALHGGNQ